MDREKSKPKSGGGSIGKINAMMLDDSGDKGYVIPVISNLRKAKDTAPILSLYHDEVFNTAATDLGVGGATRAKLRSNISKMLLDSTKATKAQKASSHASGYSSSMQDFEGSAMTQLKKLQRERMILTRLGFSEKAEKLDLEIDRVRKAALKQRESEFSKLYNDHVCVLEKKQERRADRLEAVLRAKKKILDTEIQQEYDNLLLSHQQEFLNLYANTERKAIGKVSQCNCLNEYVCHHNKSSSYNTRKSKPQVVLYRNSSKRLKQGGRSEDAVQLMELANALDYQDQDDWRKRVSSSITQSPWGANVSVVDRMIDDHKKQIETVKEAHRCKLKAYDVSSTRRRLAVKNIEISEKSRLRTKCRKIYEKILTERTSKEKDEVDRGSEYSDDVEDLPPLACTGEDDNAKTDDDRTDNDFDDCDFDNDDINDFNSEEFGDDFNADDPLSKSLPATPEFFYKESVLTAINSLVDLTIGEESSDLPKSIANINSTLADVNRLKRGLVSIGKGEMRSQVSQVKDAAAQSATQLSTLTKEPFNDTIDDSVNTHETTFPADSINGYNATATAPPLATNRAHGSPKSSLTKSFNIASDAQQVTPVAKQPSRSVSFSFDNDNIATRSPHQPTPPSQSKASTISPNSSILCHRNNSLNSMNKPGSLRDEDWVEREKAIGNGFENSYGALTDDIDATVSSLVGQLKCRVLSPKDRGLE